MERKRIGILGGLSPESTTVYYDIIIREYYKRAGDERYPEILIYSVDFDRYTQWFVDGRWEEAGRDMAEIFEKMRAVGVDFGLIAANTPHRSLEYVLRGTELPILSIIDVTADAVLETGIKTVGLLGTRFTMQEDFYKSGLSERGLGVIIPGEDEMVEVHRVIYEELVKNVVLDESRDRYIQIIENLSHRGAEGIILGCTEIPLLIREGDVGLPLFNTTEIHARAALMRAVPGI
jgi:aspartate racemase